MDTFASASSASPCRSTAKPYPSGAEGRLEFKTKVDPDFVSRLQAELAKHRSWLWTGFFGRSPSLLQDLPDERACLTAQRDAEHYVNERRREEQEIQDKAEIEKQEIVDIFQQPNPWEEARPESFRFSIAHRALNLLMQETGDLIHLQGHQLFPEGHPDLIGVDAGHGVEKESKLVFRNPEPPERRRGVAGASFGKAVNAI
jgi:hypothetical protein